MWAIQIAELSGPDAASLKNLSEPTLRHELAPGAGVLIDVRAAAVSFPDVLQSRGLYQVKPDLPFVPGAEVAGIVLDAPAGSDLSRGDRVTAFTVRGGWAERAVAPPMLTFPLPEQLSFAEGAGLVLNYHTAYFALAVRSRLKANETVLVHGAGGGVGTASLQVAKALGATAIAVVSSAEKHRVAQNAGADLVLRSQDAWREAVRAFQQSGVDVVLDPVGGSRVLDSLRALREGGRLAVVGFASGSIPEVKINRLLLNNIEVVGVGWGSYAFEKPDLCREIGERLDGMIRAGAVRPIVGATFPLALAGDAMRLIETRQAVGKVVLEIDGRGS